MSQPLLTLLASVLLALPGVACGSSDSTSPSGTPSTTAAAGARPSSPAVVHIVAPAPSQVITGPTMHVVVSLDNAHVVQQTSRTIRPDEGHVHLYVDNVLVYMAYTLQQDVPVHKGVFVLKAEFVAADHAPFSPRVITQEVVTVT